MNCLTLQLRQLCGVCEDLRVSACIQIVTRSRDSVDYYFSHSFLKPSCRREWSVVLWRVADRKMHLKSAASYWSNTRQWSSLCHHFAYAQQWTPFDRHLPDFDTNGVEASNISSIFCSSWWDRYRPRTACQVRSCNKVDRMRSNCPFFLYRTLKCIWCICCLWVGRSHCLLTYLFFSSMKWITSLCKYFVDLSEVCLSCVVCLCDCNGSLNIDFVSFYEINIWRQDIPCL